MKRLVIALTAVVLVCGVSYGQKPTSNYKHLKSFDEFIGTWRYDGDMKEDFLNLATPNTNFQFTLSYKWILKQNAVEVTWIRKIPQTIKGDEWTIEGRSLIFWNAADEGIVHGGAESFGGFYLGTLVVNGPAKSWTEEGKTIEGDGTKGSWKAKLTKTGKDTITIHVFDRKGKLTGAAPIYTLTRVKSKQP